MAPDAFDLDPTTADAVIALADPSLRAKSIARLDGGANSAVFEVRTTGGDTMIVKVYSDLFHWKMEKEVFVYRLLEGHTLTAPVPVILAADDSKTLLRQNVLVMTKLDGEHVLSLLDRLDDTELAHLNKQIGAFLRSLHEISFDQFGYVGTDAIVGPHDTNLAYMSFQFEKKLREFTDLGGDDDLRQAIAGYVAEREDLLADCPRASYCHNDCHYGNVLALPSGNGLRMSGMLDFENVLAGDPLLDLAKAHCYSSRRSEPLLAALIEGYGRVRPNWRQALDLYVLYHRLELWDWFALLGQSEALDDLADEMRTLTASRPVTTIRVAVPDDVAALSALAKRTWSDAFGGGMSVQDEAAELEEGRSETYFADALVKKTILVAEEDGALLGYVQFGDVGIPEVQLRPGDRGLHRLYVETTLQGRGIGRKLLETALQHPRLAEARRIFLQVWDKNERAVRLYESLGFKRVGTTRFTVGNEAMEDLVMILDKGDRAAPRPT
jgi:ribosomal protein S18 acetylase RimI-like enzyme/aminoglycoside phosphotransferase (APT) family kinase protein